MNNLTSIVSNNDVLPNEDITSAVTFDAEGGTTYWIAVAGFDTVGGNADLTLSFAPTPDVIPGDSNHDGVFNSADLVAVFSLSEYEDGIAGNSTFDEGDWDGDGDFDSSDFVFVFSAGTHQVNAVPQPGAIVHDEIFDASDDDRGLIVKRQSLDNHLIDAFFEDEFAPVWLV